RAGAPATGGAKGGAVMTALLLTLGALGLVPAADAGGEAPRRTRFRLENGLTVLLRPVRGSGDVALVVLYSVGGDHDPRGKSGLAHLIEHVSVTAAAG